MIISTREAFIGKKQIKDYKPASDWLVATDPNGEWSDEFMSIKNIKTKDGKINVKNYAYIGLGRLDDYLDPKDSEDTSMTAPLLSSWKYYYLSEYDLMLAIPEKYPENIVEKAKQYVKTSYDENKFNGIDVYKI